MSVTTEQIVAEARSWLGTPFVHQGRLKGVGVDCAGLVVGVARALGLAPDYVDRLDYPRQPIGRDMGDRLDRHLVHVPLPERRAADVLWFAWAANPQHLGILTGRNTVIHAYGYDTGRRQRGGVVETHLTGSHLAALRRAYRFPDLVEAA